MRGMWWARLAVEQLVSAVTLPGQARQSSARFLSWHWSTLPCWRNNWSTLRAVGGKLAIDWRTSHLSGAGRIAGEGFVRLGGGDDGAHDFHPDGESGAGSLFFIAERLAAVVADPDAAGDGGCEAEEPGVGVVAGGACFAADGVLQLRGRGSGACARDRRAEPSWCARSAG